MSRNPRFDNPGAWHHVMNRGIARRTLFETERDIRYFLSRVARAVRAGLLEVHAFSILTTHFHLLVRTSEGTLAEAMQRIQNEYARWFNRARRRDGTLYRGRYCSRPVRTLTYRRTVVRYIDANPVAAGLVADPRMYPHGSARRYATLRGPIWLERSWVQSLAREWSGSQQYRPEDYALAFGGPVPASLERLVQRRLELPADSEDPLDDLLEAATGRVANWMRRKAMLADGSRVGLPICDFDALRTVLGAARKEQGAWSVQLSRKPVDAWRQAKVVLARDLCAASFAEAGALAGVTEGGAWKLYRRHVECMKLDGAYEQRISALAERVMHAESWLFRDAHPSSQNRSFGSGIL
jgi:putative transposase